MFAVIPTINYDSQRAEVIIPERFRHLRLNSLNIFAASLDNVWTVRQNDRIPTNTVIGSVFVPEQKEQKMFTIIHIDGDLIGNFVIEWQRPEAKRPMILPYVCAAPIDNDSPKVESPTANSVIGPLSGVNRDNVLARYNAVMNNILRALGYADSIIYTCGEKFPFHYDMYQFSLQRWTRLAQVPWLRQWAVMLTELSRPDDLPADFYYSTYTGKTYGLNLDDLAKTLAYLQTIG